MRDETHQLGSEELARFQQCGLASHSDSVAAGCHNTCIRFAAHRTDMKGQADLPYPLQGQPSGAAQPVTWAKCCLLLPVFLKARSCSLLTQQCVLTGSAVQAAAHQMQTSDNRQCCAAALPAN